MSWEQQIKKKFLLKKEDEKTKEEFSFFWESRSPFSNWHSAHFKVGDKQFNCSEQYMMYEKARLFKDENMMNQIINTADCKKQKFYGRHVQNFKQSVWKENRILIVYWGCYFKFSQNPKLLKALKKTKGKTLVEASPNDKIWGIGLRISHPDAKNRNKWKGQNLLGQILTHLRCVMFKENYEYDTLKDIFDDSTWLDNEYK